MFKLDDNLLRELGLGSLPPAEKNRMLNHIYETLEMRVGMKLAQRMTNEQLDDFEAFIDRNDQPGALKWLETNFPDYKQVVADELERLKVEIKAAAPQIVAASQQQAALPQQQPPAPQNPSYPTQAPSQPPMQQPQYAPPAPSPQYSSPPPVMPQQPAPQNPSYPTQAPSQPPMQQPAPSQPQYPTPPQPPFPPTVQ